MRVIDTAARHRAALCEARRLLGLVLVNHPDYAAFEAGQEIAPGLADDDIFRAHQHLSAALGMVITPPGRMADHAAAVSPAPAVADPPVAEEVQVVRPEKLVPDGATARATESPQQDFNPFQSHPLELARVVVLQQREVAASPDDEPVARVLQAAAAPSANVRRLTPLERHAHIERRDSSLAARLAQALVQIAAPEPSPSPRKDGV